MKEVAPGVYVETAYPPYNVALILSPKGGIVVDLPPRVSHARAWLDQVRSVAGSVRYVILTDANPDRLLALVTCEEQVIGTEAMLRLTAAWEERAWREFIQDRVTQYQEEASDIARAKPRRPTLAFNGTLTLPGDTHTVRLEPIYGAAPGSLIVELPDASLLIAGDTVVTDEPPPLDQTPDSKAWLDALATLSRRTTIQHIIPGRGSALILRGDIEQQRELLRIMRRTARSLARGTLKNTSITETAQDIGQAFFNATGQRAVKRIRAGLEHLMLEVHQLTSVDTERPPDEEA